MAGRFFRPIFPRLPALFFLPVCTYSSLNPPFPKRKTRNIPEEICEENRRKQGKNRKKTGQEK
jgi:hypothetical protein